MKTNHLSNAFITIGNFDGLHLGHQALIQETRLQAKAAQKPAGLLTFYPHPRQILYPEKPFFTIFNPTQKKAYLNNLNLDFIVEQKIDFEWMQKSPDNFLDYLKKDLNIAGLIVGEDFRFGKNKIGNIEYIQNRVHQHAFFLHAFQKQKISHEICSSSSIKNYIQTGNLKKAKDLLGRAYSLEGPVAREDKGFKVTLDPQAVLPPFGIYNCFASFNGDKITYAGTAHLCEKGLKVILLDFHENCDKKRLEVFFS